MAAIKTLIVDDEKQARNSLKADLAKHKDIIHVVGEADSVLTALERIEELKPQLVFLDINLGDGSGFSVIEKSVFKDFKVIFVTAYDQYAIRAFKVSALDFLLKPVDIDELETAIGKLRTLVPISQEQSNIEAFKTHTSGNINTDEKKIVLKDLESIHIIKLKDLICCEASGIYTTFHLVDNSQLVISKNLKEYDDMLVSYGFIRVHNSFLVNSTKITKFEKGDGGMLILEGNRKIPVSQRKRDVVLEFLRSL